MKKIADKMLITVVLLIFSYFIAAGGFCLAVILIVTKLKDTDSLIYGFLILIGSLLLAALIKMFANIGQMIFDMRVDIQRLFGQSRELEEKLNQDLRNQLQRQANALDQNLHIQTETIVRNLQAIIQKLDKSFQEAKELEQRLNLDMTITLTQNLRAQTDALVHNLQVIIQRLVQSSQEAQESEQRFSQDLNNQLQRQTDALDQNLHTQTDALVHNLQVIIQKLVQSSQEAQELGQQLASIGDNFDQMNCDSKDMNQNIQQIKSFFEQIEKHLDLKK